MVANLCERTFPSLFALLSLLPSLSPPLFASLTFPFPLFTYFSLPLCCFFIEGQIGSYNFKGHIGVASAIKSYHVMQIYCGYIRMWVITGFKKMVREAVVNYGFI